MSGTLYGLGVGPGDPDLITVKALRILQVAPVIAYPAPVGGDSLVRSIAAPHIPLGRTEMTIEIPMLPGDFPARDLYRPYAFQIADHLTQGRDVAVLCEGDPFFYGSFMYLFEELAGDHPTCVVPGVSSLGACAAAAGIPMVSRNQVLSIIPATLPEDQLADRLGSVQAAALIKVGRHLGKVRRVLEGLGLDGDARYVERATMETERVLPLSDVADGGAPYFSMILVRRSDDAGA